MTIPEAASLVIQAGAMGTGGEVFILDMGEPIKILDLAKKMIHLSGLEAGTDSKRGDIEIKFTGLRPGEKLHEELLIGDNIFGTEHPKIICAQEESITLDEFKASLEKIIHSLKEDDFSSAHTEIKEIVDGFSSTLKISDHFFALESQSSSIKF